MAFARRTTLILSLVACAAGQAQDDECDSADVSLAQLRMEATKAKVAAAQNASETDPEMTQECYAFTGQTCDSRCIDPYSDCKAGRCYCKKGCAGVSGQCHNKQNILIASNFVLKNAARTDYKLYVQRFSEDDQLRLTPLPSVLNLGQDKWNLYELQGESSLDRRFFLASNHWKRYVAAPTATGVADKWDFNAVDLDAETPINPSNFALRVCSLGKKGFPGAIAFGGYSDWAGKRGIYASATEDDRLVYGVQDQQGAMQRWIPDPLFSDNVLPDC